MLLSGGDLILADSVPSYGNVFYTTPAGLDLSGLFASYAEIYKKQLWVYAVVRKLALGTSRLPLKVYRGTDLGRDEVKDSPYAKLLANPNPRVNAKFLWEWTVSTGAVYGEAMWLKVRGSDGRPSQLWPLHPANVFVKRDADTGDLSYTYYRGAPQVAVFTAPARDVVHFRSYNPDSTLRGLSPLEPLRQTLLNEDAARRATQSFWKNGARPGVALSHPRTLSPDAMKRLRDNWDALHGGTDNTGNTAVLEEGMEPKILPINLEEAQYIETRRLNREEVVAAYDVPPPVVHILDRATFSNITEQMRSMYRDTMAPRLQLLEADLDFQLRPDFGDDIYAEFLMDEVLRGDFETRMEAYTKAIAFGIYQPAEARKKENLPFIEGSDRLFMNSTNIPIDEVSSHTSPNPPAEDVPGATPAVEEAPTTPPALINKRTPSDQVPALRSLMSRIGRAEHLTDIDPDYLTEGLNGMATVVKAELFAATSLAEFKTRLKALFEEQA